MVLRTYLIRNINRVLENIRTNFSTFATNGNYNLPHKKKFENLLISYKDGIIERLFENLTNGSGLPSSLIGKILLDRIILSNQIKYRYYGLDAATNREKNKPYTPDSTYEKNEEFYHDLDKAPNEKAKDYIKDDTNPDDEYRSFSDLICGEYYRDQRTIVLYVEAMKKTGKTGRELEDLFLSVLIHEYFHAVHHTYLYKKGSNIDYYKDYDIIFESLAAAFEYQFCKDTLRNYDLAKELEDTWRKHSVLVYPYSGAKEIVLRDSNLHYSINEVEEKLLKKEDELEKKGVNTDHIRDLQHMLDSLSHRYYGMVHIRSYFVLSISSLWQAQVELLSHCL